MASNSPFNSPPTTPKRNWPSTPSGALQRTPTAKRKAESRMGYVISVGPIEESRNMNLYFNIRVQITKTETTSFRVMQQKDNCTREDFLPLVGQSVYFECVFPADGCFFYWKHKGSRHTISDSAMSFEISDSASTVAHVHTQESGMFDLKVVIRWMGEPKEKNGGLVKVAQVADATGDISLSVWKEPWFGLSEDQAYMITDLKLRDNFGKELSTSHMSTYREIQEVIDPKFSFDIMEIRKKDAVQSVNFDDIEAVTLSSKAICPKCKDKVQLVDGEVLEFLDCNTCKRSFKLKKAQFELIGHIDTGQYRF